MSCRMDRALSHEIAAYAAGNDYFTMQFNAMCDRLDMIPNADRKHALKFFGTLAKAASLKMKQPTDLATRMEAAELLLEKYYAGRGGKSGLQRNSILSNPRVSILSNPRVSILSNPTKQVTGRFSDLIGNRRLK